MGFFQRIKHTLTKTSTGLSESLKDVFVRKKLDDDMCEALEDALIMSDMGAQTALELVAQLRQSYFEKDVSEQEVRAFLAEKISHILSRVAKPLELPEQTPAVLLMVGVNGAGKTTTIGKLASQFKADGKNIMLAAGDTFRAGAVEQLKIWAQRVGCPIEVPAKEGADASAVLYKAYEKAISEKADILLADTAGRLQNRKELMDELEKIVRVLKKHNNAAPHHTLLVIDATVGQNAMRQVEAFINAADISGLIITKLDSSAKGGVIVSLAAHYNLPIHAIGHGEKIEDLAPFEPKAFANALMNVEKE